MGKQSEIILWVVVSTIGYCTIAFLNDITTHVPSFIVIFTILFIAYLKIYALFPHVELKPKFQIIIILTISISFQCMVLPCTPNDDIYRYIWEGALILKGINPYLHAPQDLILLSQTYDNYSLINHQEISAIYPPATLLFFAFCALVSTQVIFFKICFVLLHLLALCTLLGLLKKFNYPYHNSLLYGLNPLTIIMIGARGHFEPLLLFFLLLSLLFYLQSKFFFTGISLTVAVLSKFIGLILIPWLLFKKDILPVIVVLVISLCFYLPFYSGIQSSFKTLFSFGKEFTFNSSLHGFFTWIISWCVSFFHEANLREEILWIVTILSVCVFGSLIFYMLRRNFEMMPYLYFSCVWIILLSPTVHPWYLLWALCFVPFVKYRSWITLTYTSIYYYLLYISSYPTGLWEDAPLRKLLIYIPFYLHFAYESRSYILSKVKIIPPS